MAGLASLYLKSLLRARSKSWRTEGAVDALPELRTEARIDPEHLARFREVCGFPAGDRHLPGTYPHVFAFPLSIEIMTGTAFPLPLHTVLHLGNSVEQHRPVPQTEPLDLRVRVAEFRRHRRGIECDVREEAYVAGELVWSGVSTYFWRRSLPDEPEREHADEPELDLDRPRERWTVPADTGRRYAAVSGDRNPIHLHRLPARLMGFRTAIAHGMWTKSRSLAALSERLPANYRFEVTFRRPVPLPSEVVFAVEGDRCAVADPESGRRYLTGSLG